ncbi:hypothetical protein N9786_00525 [Flavobacteriaceae bacterium]|nr:hypothetical protein [Flavobacteriaceae bacterium]
MRYFFITLVLICFSSCLVVKIYENPEANSDHTSDAVCTQRQMIGSGKKIDLGKQGEREILFIGKYNKPKNVFHQTDSIFPASATWISHNNSNIKFIIAKNEETKPLIVVDGKISSNSEALKEINPNEIESVNILRGEVAIKKYGKEAQRGVIEIITKKN